MPPADYDVWCKTAESAIALLLSGLVDEISLDHDLGGKLTGCDVANSIEDLAFNTPSKISNLIVRIHSANPVGCDNIKRAIRAAERWSKRKILE